MLKEISIKNYLSFNDWTLFTMEADADRVSEYQDHIVNICDSKILKVSSFYGPNGGGKSNLLKSILLLKEIVNGGTIVGTDYQIEESLLCAFSGKKNIELMAFFVTDIYEIGYSCEVRPSKKRSDLNESSRPFDEVEFQFIAESMSYREKGMSDFQLLFNRNDYGEIDGDVIKKDVNSNLFVIAKTMPFVKYCFDMFINSRNELSTSLDVINSFIDQVKSIVFINNNVGIPMLSNKGIEEVNKNHEKIVSLLNKVDISIKSFFCKKTNDVGWNKIYFTREIDFNGKKKEISLPLSSESAGTQKIFTFFLRLLKIMNNGGIILYDDMNAYLHPKLMSAIIDMFQTNNEKSQLIFNSHDITNMNNKMFRRDEIWFAYRDEKYATNIVPLSSIVNFKGNQVRNDASFGKQYLEGKFGADPFIQRGFSWDD